MKRNRECEREREKEKQGSMVFFEKVIINITRKENVKTWADWKGCECSQSFFSPPPPAKTNPPHTYIGSLLGCSEK